MSLKAIEQLLEKKIGLSVATVGSDSVLSVVRRRMEVCGNQDYWAYLTYLNTSDSEWDELIEAIVVPETWFFRNEDSFAFLRQYIKTEWMQRHPDNVLRALSIPCSTGEEPYSITIAFLEAGLPQERFTVEAIDISKKALDKAQQGIYGQESFRRQDTLHLRDRYFTTIPEGYQLEPMVKNAVRFLRGNILDTTLFTNSAPYDIIFCRNLLIYLGAAARDHVSQTIDRLLTKTGIVFVGHAERPLFQAEKFTSITTPGVFAYYRAGELNECKICRQQRTPPRFERRKSSRIVPLDDQPKPSASPEKRAPQKGAESQPAPALPVLIERRKPNNNAVKKLDTAREFADHGELRKALTLCHAVLTENAAHVQAHFLAGLIYQALKNEDLAEKSFNKTIYLDPDHHEALYYLALIMEDRGQNEKAQQLRQRIHRIYQRKRTK